MKSFLSTNFFPKQQPADPTPAPNPVNSCKNIHLNPSQKNGPVIQLPVAMPVLENNSSEVVREAAPLAPDETAQASFCSNTEQQGCCDYSQWPSEPHQPQDTCRRTLVLGETPQSFRETCGGQIPPCHGLSARMPTVDAKLLTILKHAERHAQLGFPNSTLQFSPYFTHIHLWTLPAPQSSRTELGLHHRSAA